jgi:hypothetical protein
MRACQATHSEGRRQCAERSHKVDEEASSGGVQHKVTQVGKRVGWTTYLHIRASRVGCAATVMSSGACHGEGNDQGSSMESDSRRRSSRRSSGRGWPEALPDRPGAHSGRLPCARPHAEEGNQSRLRL